MNGRAAVVAIDMGYGHLRPARTLSMALEGSVMHADKPPLSDLEEQKSWQRIRMLYEGLSRVSSVPLIGRPMSGVLNALTDIPRMHPFRDLSSPQIGSRMLEYAASRGLGHSLVSYLQDRDLPLLTTFYAPAVIADFHGYDQIYCVVTDSDINRIWAPITPASSKIKYFAPSGRVVRRLRAYGVNKDSIELTGFPLPHTLVGGPDATVLRANLTARISRLDPKGIFRKQFAAELQELGPPSEPESPPHLVFAVGGAGAQADLPSQFLPRLAPHLRDGRFKLTLVAGVRKEVLRVFEIELERHGFEVESEGPVQILFADELDDYFERFDALLAKTDVLWTKPSEMVFYAGLGIPLLLTEPIGVHERFNRQFARENGVALKQRDPHTAGDRLLELLEDGHLAAAAWAGYRRMPHLGLYRILERLS